MSVSQLLVGSSLQGTSNKVITFCHTQAGAVSPPGMRLFLVHETVTLG